MHVCVLCCVCVCVCVFYSFVFSYGAGRTTPVRLAKLTGLHAGQSCNDRGCNTYMYAAAQS